LAARRGHWKGATAFQVWGLTILGLVLVVGNIIVQYGINVWNRAFFNALEQHDATFAYRAIVLFFVLAFLAALVAVLQLVFRMKLQILLATMVDAAVGPTMVG
jgi:putative ATP-binding cassette transporter